MFSADLHYNFQTEEKAKNAAEKLTKEVKAEENYSFEFLVEENSVLAKVKATTSEALRIGMNVLFPVIDEIETEARVETQ